MRRLVDAKVVVAVILSVGLVVSCSGGDGGGDPGAAEADTTLALVASAVSERGWATVEPAFAATREGDGVAVKASYGASGDQSRSVADGESADVVSFAAPPDITRLVEAGKVDENWDAGVTRGIPFGSVVSFAVRPGNPKNIRDWNDLLRSDVEVITPDPQSSGSAKWNLLAAYAWASNGGQDPQAGRDYVGELVTDHVRERPTSARAAAELFTGGSGDVLLGYESQALDAALEHVIPPQTIKVENPVAVVNTSRHLEQAIDFVNFQFTPAAQKLWAEANFRPVDPAVLAEYADRFPPPDKLWTVEDLGGWEVVDRQFFDEDNGTITEIYR